MPHHLIINATILAQLYTILAPYWTTIHLTASNTSIHISPFRRIKTEWLPKYPHIMLIIIRLCLLTSLVSNVVCPEFFHENLIFQLVGALIWSFRFCHKFNGFIIEQTIAWRFAINPELPFSLLNFL